MAAEKIHLPGGKKGERQLQRLLKPIQNRQISSELNVTEAWVAKVDRRLQKLENADTGRDRRLNKMWRWAQEKWRKEGWNDDPEDNAGTGSE